MAKPTLSEISKLFKTDDKPTDFHYYGTVVSADINNRTYEVSINRDENITVEAARLVGAHVGDTVMVTVMANGYATVTGRVGGDTDASDAQRKADSASTIADQAQAKAVSALGKATAAEQLANQAEQNAKRSADAAEEAEESAGLAAEAAGQAEQSARDSQTAAETAQQNAADSQTAAEAAQQNAAGSQTAAERARDRAAAAEGYADTAQKQAAKAEKEASTANSYAVGALNSLSTTQDIMGVLSWVEESIKYVWDYPPTAEDKEYDPSKQYYTVIGKRVIEPIETDYDKYYVLNSESEPASKTGNIVTFDSDLDNFPLKSLTATITPKQSGSGDPSPDNVRPISGWDSVSASVCGRNLLRGNNLLGSNENKIFGWELNGHGNPDIQVVDGEECVHIGFQMPAGNKYIPSIRHASRVLLEWGEVEYTISCDLKVDDEIKIASSTTPLHFHNGETDDADPFNTTTVNDGKGFTFVSITPAIGTIIPENTWVHIEHHIKTKATGEKKWPTYRPFIFGAVRTSADESKFVNVYLKNYKIERGNTPTDYEPYTGDTYTTDMPETVYGGSLDVVNGVLTVDRAMVDLGTLTWNYNASWGGYPAFYCSVAPTGIKVPSTSSTLIGAICSQYTEVKRDYLYSNNVTAFCIPSDGKVSVRDSRYTSASDFKTAMNGVRLVYELAEPRTIQLTPTQINTLLGENNLWADSGAVTVEYWDGPVGYVTPTSSFDPTETYYTVKGSPVKIDESKQEEHGKGLYYVHDLTNAKEAMADFIKAHLALTGEGLYVLKGEHDWRVLVANDGVYIIDPQGRRVASYKDSITLGTSEGNSIRITSEAITFNIGDKTFAYVAQDKWFASNAEVSGAMYIGDYSLRQKSNGDFVLGRRR